MFIIVLGGGGGEAAIFSWKKSLRKEMVIVRTNFVAPTLTPCNAETRECIARTTLSAFISIGFKY